MFILLLNGKEISVPNEQVFSCLGAKKKKYTLPNAFEQKGNVILNKKDGKVVLEKVISLDAVEKGELPFGFVVKGNGIFDRTGVLILDLADAAKKLSKTDNLNENKESQSSNKDAGDTSGTVSVAAKKKLEAELNDSTVAQIEEYLIKKLKASPSQLQGLNKTQKIVLALELSFPD